MINFLRAITKRMNPSPFRRQRRAAVVRHGERVLSVAVRGRRGGRLRSVQTDFVKAQPHRTGEKLAIRLPPQLLTGTSRIAEYKLEVLEDRTLPSTILVTGLGDTVSDGDGQVTLREAIQAANTNLPVNGSTAGEVDDIATDIITFDPSLNGGIIRLGGTALTISSNLSIIGPGANLLTLNGDSDNDGTGNSRIFNVDDGVASQRSVTISGLTLTRGNASGGPASGGAIFNTENLTVIRSTMSGNSANNGGGGIGNDGTLTLMQSTVSGNSAINNAGGIGNNFGTMTVIQSTISGNSAGRSAGGLTTMER